MIGALRRPNILHVITDDQTYNTVTAESMPWFSSEPHGNWVKFDRAVITTPLCHPARASMITGQRSDHHGRITNNSAPPNFPEADTAGVWMRNAGYWTGMFGKYLNGYPWTGPAYLPPGWDDWFSATGDAGTYTAWTAVDKNLTPYVGTGGSYFPDVVSDRVVNFINNAPDDRPWFAYYAPITPHNPFEPAARHASIEIADEFPPNYNLPDVSTQPNYTSSLPLLTEAQQVSVNANRKNTKRMMRALDESLQAVFAAIEAAGQLDNTIVFFHTDNGYPFGEHRRHTGLPGLPKGVPYRWCLDPQLRIRYPGARARVEHAPVTTNDCTATWVGAANATPGHALDGVSLERILCEQPINWRTQVEAFYTGSSGIPRWWAAVRQDGKKVVRYTTGEYELYDWTTDPDELTSLHATSPATVTAMDTELSALIANSLYWHDPAQALPDYADGNPGVPPGPPLVIRGRHVTSIRSGGVTRTLSEVRRSSG